MWASSTIFILWYHTFFRLLLAENRDIKFLRFFAKMKNDREGGVRGGFRIFPELRKVLGCHMPNFRSLGQSLHIDIFCKNQGVGGEWGAPYYPFGRKSPSIIVAEMGHRQSSGFSLPPPSNYHMILLDLVRKNDLGLWFCFLLEKGRF